jgi:hypothetical protein
MKQTAVEWLIDQLTPSISLQQKHIDELKNQAKEMEKEQIIKAIDYCRERYIDSENYYNETYGGEK